MITAYRIQIAVPLAATAAAQIALDNINPGVWALSPEPGAVKALSSDPQVAAFAVGSGRVTSENYASIAAIAAVNSISHLPVSQWESDGETEEEIIPDGVGNLWTSMNLVDVDENIGL